MEEVKEEKEEEEEEEQEEEEEEEEEERRACVIQWRRPVTQAFENSVLLHLLLSTLIIKKFEI